MNADEYSASAIRRGARQYLSGKLLSAPLSLAALLWSVRLLPLDEYASYVTLIATVEFCLVFGAFGLPWMASRYLPEFNLRAPGRPLVRLSLRLLCLQAMALCAVAAALVAVIRWQPTWAPPANGTLAVWLGALLVVEGLGRFCRDAMLAPLMMQGPARASLIVRQALLVGGIGVAAWVERPDARTLIVAEFVAASASTTIALWALRARLRRSGSVPDPAEVVKLTVPAASVRVALTMYGAHLLSLAYSPLVLLQLIQRMAGAEAAALFGFLRLVHDQVARYLPAMLLFSLIRPKLMASLVQSGFAELNRNAILCGKLSLFVLCPVIIVAAVVGDPLVALLSSGRFQASGVVLLGFLLVLVPLSQRQLIESVAVAADEDRLCLFAAAVSALSLPLVVIAWPGEFGVWPSLTAMAVGHVMFDGVMAMGLSRRVGLQADAGGWLRLAMPTVVAVAAGWLAHTLPVVPSARWLPWVAAALAVAVFLGLARLLGAFTVPERERINQLLGRRAFVW